MVKAARDDLSGKMCPEVEEMPAKRRTRRISGLGMVSLQVQSWEIGVNKHLPYLCLKAFFKSN